MAILKLSFPTTTTTTTASSFSAKWARTLPTTVSSAVQPPISSINSKGNVTNDWRRIAACATIRYYSFVPPNNSAGLLGFHFRLRNRFSIFSPNSSTSSSAHSSSSSAHSSSSEGHQSSSAGGFSGSDSSSSGSGLVVDIMGSEDDNNNNKVQQNGEWHRKPPPSSKKQQQRKQGEDSVTKLLTLPTILTLGRVFAVPLLISTFYLDTWSGRTATTVIFIAAAVTDWLDGYLARKMGLGSAFGAFLDPVADKLMVAATLVLLCTKPPEVAVFGQVPWLLTVPAIAIIGREITMSAVREWAASQNGKLLEAVAVNNLGKWKTATQMIALTILLAIRDNSLGEPGILAASGVVLLYISAGLSVWSLGVYMSKIWRVLLK
ncbi:CDP-diacylglycerol--glycerol-3-phosphate 3-phosphatidyltransferase 2 [Euphorbia peplus]|nr:CDP-diacylglycerol--glycerol-3-phosphate 3-phosphatidyltransferase 2 [Euphorbia peplus]